jgi:hypothetical protein
VRALSGFTVQPAAESGDKRTRFGPFSSQCRVANVKILRGLWNEDLFRVLEGFPDLAHDDASSSMTQRWREMDSNFQFRARRAGVLTGLANIHPAAVAPEDKALAQPAPSPKPDIYVETYVTGYNTVPGQTDDTPCIAAS